MAKPCIRAPSSWGLFLFFLISAPLSQPVIAALAPPDISIEQLANHPQWLHLLHYDTTAQQGTFLTEGFYLDPQGQHNPEAELKTTLRASNTPVTDESHPRCRFPARYTWLADHLHQPQWKTIPPACQNLQQWLNKNPLRSISMLMVSGYMGNPASMFGHSILKLNAANDSHDLFSTSINYGALVPPKEPIIVYIFKGLFGGYQAGYSDRYFYTQDVVYTNTEARDIWEYELNLSPDQLNLLQRHIWEIIGKKKQYFFLTRNCAYELARVVDVIMDPPLAQPAHAWYAPVELFDRLHDLDQSAQIDKHPSLIKQPRYHPSAERALIHHYENLDGELKFRAEQFLKKPEIAQIDATLSRLEADKQQALLDFLFSYQHFVFTKEQPQPSAKTLSIKHALQIKRLSLPPSSRTDSQPPYRPSPSEGQKPSIIGVGVMAQEDGKLQPTLNLAAFAQEPTGRNTLDGGELTVLDLRLNLSADTPLVDRLDYLRIFHHALSPLPMASPWSWRLQLRSAREPDGKYDHQFYLGAGRSKRLRQTLLYILLTPSLHSQAPVIRLRPEAGLLLPLQGKLRTRFSLGMENTTDDWQTTALGTIQYNLSRKLSIQLEYQKETVSSWQLALRTHW